MDPNNQTPVSQSTVPVQASVEGQDPGKTLSIVGLILAFVGVQLVGLILSIIAYKKSAKAGFKNGIALAGIILNSIFMVIGAAIITLLVWLAISGVQAYGEMKTQCEDLGTGIHQHVEIKGTSGTLTCGVHGNIDFSSPNLHLYSDL